MSASRRALFAHSMDKNVTTPNKIYKRKRENKNLKAISAAFADAIFLFRIAISNKVEYQLKI